MLAALNRRSRGAPSSLPRRCAAALRESPRERTYTKPSSESPFGIRVPYAIDAALGPLRHRRRIRVSYLLFRRDHVQRIHQQAADAARGLPQRAPLPRRRKFEGLRDARQPEREPAQSPPPSPPVDDATAEPEVPPDEKAYTAGYKAGHAEGFAAGHAAGPGRGRGWINHGINLRLAGLDAAPRIVTEARRRRRRAPRLPLLVRDGGRVPRPAFAGLQLTPCGARSRAIRASGREGGLRRCVDAIVATASPGPSRRGLPQRNIAKGAFGGRFDLHVAFFDGPAAALGRSTSSRARRPTSGFTATEPAVAQKRRAVGAAPPPSRACSSMIAEGKLGRPRTSGLDDVRVGVAQKRRRSASMHTRGWRDGRSMERRATRFGERGGSDVHGRLPNRPGGLPCPRQTSRDAGGVVCLLSRLSCRIKTTLDPERPRYPIPLKARLMDCPGRAGEGSDVLSSDTSLGS